MNIQFDANCPVENDIFSYTHTNIPTLVKQADKELIFINQTLVAEDNGLKHKPHPN